MTGMKSISCRKQKTGKSLKQKISCYQCFIRTTQRRIKTRVHFITIQSSASRPINSVNDHNENLAVKNLSEFLRWITSKNNSDYYCINCLHSFRSAHYLKLHEDCKDHDYCRAKMREAHNNILKLNHQQKSLKIPFFIYAGTESLL